ncbi:MAG: hypothetical protein JSS86_14160, partial [Cyanobacteria bacterium SZAS LIN-2]|nr:hypothetical protein [Cyanobacteria bacterium SZAS LIN-2]
LKTTLPANVVMVAGSQFNLSSTGTNVDQITVTGNSSLGGNIDLSAGSYSIDTSSNSGNNSGGNVILAAFSGSKATNGFVNISGDITTNGDFNGANGNIEITAGTTATAAAITVGNLNVGAGGTTAGTGNVTLENATPNVSTPVSLLFSTPSFSGGATTNLVGQITTGTITMNGGNVTIQQGGTLNVPTGIVGSVNTYSVASNSDVTIAAGKTISGTNTFLAQALDAGAGSGNINVNGTIKATTTVLLSKNDVNFGASSAITSAKGLTVVAARDILATGAGVAISTDGGGNAGPLTMVAGALFSTNNTQVTITGPSTTGGSIDFKTSGSVSSFGSGSLAGSGGDTILAAFDDSGASGSRGNIFITGAPIVAGGKTTSGSVAIIAGKNGANSIDISGGIDVSKGTGGNVYIAAAAPNATALNPVVINMNGGTIASGTFVGGAIATGGSSFGVSSVAMNGGSLTVIQDLSINTGTGLPSITNPGFITLQSNHDITVINAITAKGVQLMAGGSIFVDANITSPQGITLIAGQDIGAPLPVSLSTSAVGNAGQINAIAGATFTYDGTSATITAINSNNVVDLTIVNALSAQSSTGSGGSITLVGGRSVLVNSTIVIKTDGAAGSNGDVVIVGGNPGGTAISIGDVDISGGGVAGSGKIVLQAATPNVSSKSPLVLTAAKLVSGDPTGGALATGDILTGNLRADAATIQVLSGHNVVLGNVTVSNPSLPNASGGKIDITTYGTEVLQIGGSKGISKNYIASVDAGADSLSTLSQNGSITISNLHSGVISNGGIQVQGNAIKFVNGRSGTISLTAGSAVGDNIDLGSENTLDLSSTALTTTATGGKISLIGNLITSSAPLTLRADSSNPSSDGGSIIFQQANTAAYTINSSNILFNVTGGKDGTSGSIVLENGGSINYSPSGAATALQFAANPAGGSGGSLTLKAGYFQDQPLATTTANLLISGALSANGVGSGKGGSFDLESNSTTTFNIGATTNNINGVLGSVSVAGAGGNGNITVVNNAGGVTNTVALTAVNQISFTAGGAGDVAIGAALGTAVNPNNPSAPHTDTISLTANGTGSITQTKTTNVIAANNLFLIAKSGSVGGKAVLAVNAPTLQALAGTTVSLSDSALDVHLLDSQAGSTSAFTLTATNNLKTGNIDAGSVSLTARAITLGGNIKASNGSAGNVTITATSTDITSSQLEDTSASGSITLSAVNGTIEIGNLGSKLAPSKITATALNGIDLTSVKALDAVTLKSTGTGVNSTIGIANDLVATNSTSVVSLTANAVAGGIQVGGDLSAGKSVTVTAPSGYTTIGTIGQTLTPSTVAITTSLGIDSGNITAGTSVTLKTTSTSNAGTPGGIQLGDVFVTSKTAGVIAITSNGIVHAIDTGLLDASKSVTLTAARGEILSDKIGSLVVPGTVSLSALGFIATSDITAVNSVAIKTTAKAFPDGDIVINGQVQATAAGKGTVTITSASVGGNGIDNLGDISGSTVTLTAAKASITSNSIGGGVATGKVVLSSLN